MLQQQFLHVRAGAGDLISARSINRIPIPYPAPANYEVKSNKLFSKTFQIFKLSSKINDFQLIARKDGSGSGKNQRGRLFTISTSDGKWKDSWSCDYILSLGQLGLKDLVENEQRNADVSISLCIHKHAGFGLSVDGRIMTSFTRKCSCCSSPYCRQIDTNFNVWILPSTKDNRKALQLPEIGGDDPSVIYVKPGCEANLDSLIQETVRLTISVKDTCSELCEKSEPTIQCIVGGQNAATATIDGRWSKLLELRNAKL